MSLVFHINVIMLDVNNEGDKKTQFKWKQGEGLNLSDEITVIFFKIHYEVGYTKSDFDSIDKIYKNNFLHNKQSLRQNKEKSEILNNRKKENKKKKEALGLSLKQKEKKEVGKKCCECF